MICYIGTLQTLLLLTATEFFGGHHVSANSASFISELGGDILFNESANAAAKALPEPLPIPADATFRIGADGAADPVFEIDAVYMACMNALYNRSIATSTLPHEHVFYVRDFSNRTDPGPMLMFFPASQPLRTLLNRDIIWTSEELLRHLEPFRGVKKTPRLSFRFSSGRAYQGLTIGQVQQVRSDADLDIAPRPEFSFITTKYFPQAQPLDPKATFLAALKVFKRVFVENKGLVVPTNWAFASGDVEFQLMARLGRPRTVTWKDLAQATMALLQFVRSGDGRLREAKAFISRGGDAIGRLDVVMKEGQPATHAVTAD